MLSDGSVLKWPYRWFPFHLTQHVASVFTVKMKD